MPIVGMDREESICKKFQKVVYGSLLPAGYLHDNDPNCSIC